MIASVVLATSPLVHADSDLAQNKKAYQYYKQGNYTATLPIWQKLAEQGNTYAQSALAELYMNGNGVQENTAKAIELYKTAALKGDLKAQHNLGNYYHEKLRDDAEAVKWWTMAANQENDKRSAASQNNLGMVYLDGGRNVKQDYQLALNWFQKAANQGDVEAQTSLGSMYGKGLGTKQDDKLSFEWHLKAAKNGKITAQRNVGTKYYNGVGVKQDYKQAFYWFQKAAEQGDEKSQYYLGYLYHKGEGTIKDLVMAKKWYEKAAAQGNQNAIDELKNLK